MPCSNDITCTVFGRCAKNLFCQKIRYITQHNIFLKDSSNKVDTYPLKAIIELQARKAVEESVTRSSDAEVMWSTFDDARKTSFVGFAQVWSDNSQTSLSSSAVVPYPLYLTLLNFSELQNRKLIEQGFTILPHLWISVCKIRDSCKTRTDPVKNSNCSGMMRCSKTMHEFSEALFQPFGESAPAGLLCQVKEKRIEGTRPACVICCWYPWVKRSFQLENRMTDRVFMLMSR